MNNIVSAGRINRIQITTTDNHIVTLSTRERVISTIGGIGAVDRCNHRRCRRAKQFCVRNKIIPQFNPRTIGGTILNLTAIAKDNIAPTAGSDGVRAVTTKDNEILGGTACIKGIIVRHVGKVGAVAMRTFQINNKYVFVALGQRCSHHVIAQPRVQIDCFNHRIIYIRSCDGKGVVTGTGPEIYLVQQFACRRRIFSVIERLQRNSAICSQATH